jgi:hypothetical protein
MMIPPWASITDLVARRRPHRLSDRNDGPANRHGAGRNRALLAVHGQDEAVRDEKVSRVAVVSCS